MNRLTKFLSKDIFCQVTLNYSCDQNCNWRGRNSKTSYDGCLLQAINLIYWNVFDVKVKTHFSTMDDIIDNNNVCRVFMRFFIWCTLPTSQVHVVRRPKKFITKSAYHCMFDVQDPQINSLMEFLDNDHL